MHPTNRQRRGRTTLSLRRAGLVLALLTGLASQAGAANRILAIVYDGPAALDPNIDHLRNNLQAGPDNVVTWRRGPFDGTLASLLQQGSYDQVWIWDMDIYSPSVNADDRAALAAWYAAHPNIVLDSRSGGIHADNDAAEQTLTNNIVAQLAARNGGLWIGAKHATEGTQTANTYLSALQSGAFAGSWQDDQMLTGSNSPLLAGIPDIQSLRWFYHDAFTRSAAPTLGPGGVPLNTVLSDADGHPLITTTIPEPPQGLLGGLGAAALGWLRRRRGRAALELGLMRPTNRQRRGRTTLSLRRAGLVLALLTGLASQAGAANRILAIVYDGPAALDPNIDHLRNNLQAGPDNIVTWRRGPFDGTLATLLQQGSFDQVWIWDMDIYPPSVNADDRAALATWYAAHPNIVLDSRSAGIWADNDAAERTLTNNIVAQLAARNGGLWIGAKQATEGTQTANTYLSALQSGLFTGSWQDYQVLTGSNNPLLAGIPDVQALHWSSVGAFARSAAPTLGPGGVPLSTVLSDADGHPLITTTIPEPQGLLGGLGAAALGWLRRRR